MIHGMPEKYIESDSQLTTSEKNITRACSSCGGEMKPSKKVIENSLFILRDNGILYRCDNCDASVIFQSYPTIFLKFATFLMAIGIIVAVFMNSYLELITNLFKESIGFAALSILICCIALLLITGGGVNGISLINTIRKSAKHPLISGQSKLRMLFVFVLTMLYGLLPWVIFGGVGFLNDTVMHIDRDWALPLIIPGFVPIFLAPKVGISIQGAFFATASYPAAGLFLYFFI
jgi:hypothetical protein